MAGSTLTQLLKIISKQTFYTDILAKNAKNLRTIRDLAETALISGIQESLDKFDEKAGYKKTEEIFSLSSDEIEVLFEILRHITNDIENGYANIFNRLYVIKDVREESELIIINIMNKIEFGETLFTTTELKTLKEIFDHIHHNIYKKYDNIIYRIYKRQTDREKAQNDFNNIINKIHHFSPDYHSDE